MAERQLKAGADASLKSALGTSPADLGLETLLLRGQQAEIDRLQRKLKDQLEVSARFVLPA